MSIITRSVHNATLKDISLPVPGYDTVKPPVVIPSGVTVDLFTVITGDELEAIQPTLNQYIATGEFTVIATVDTATFNPVGGSGGLSQLTGDVTAGPGSGSQAATVASVGGVSAATLATSVTTANNALPRAGGTLTGDLTLTPSVGNATLSLSGTLRTGLIYTDKANSDALVIDPGTNPLFVAYPNSGVVIMSYYTLQSLQDIETSGAIAAGTTTPDASAILTATSTTRGFLPPRMTTTEKVAISTPTEGLTVYDTTLHKLSVFTGSVWETVTSA
jgi:hypothetical protein